METFMAIPETVSYSELRANLATYLDRVYDDSLPLVVKRKNGKRLVITTEEHYNRMDETAYLMASPANAKHLRDALKGDPKKRTKYKSVAEFSKKHGI